MSKENTRNVIILKNLPSNLIAEAILVVKDKKQVADYMKELYNLWRYKNRVIKEN